MQQRLRRRQKQAGLLASATALREAADRRVAEAELGCERRLDDLEASLKARPVACVLAVLQGLGVCSKHGSAFSGGRGRCLRSQARLGVTVRCTPYALQNGSEPM